LLTDRCAHGKLLLQGHASRVRRPTSASGRIRRMDDLAGRTAVVTGGGSGIGRAIALELASAGMNVVIADIEPVPARDVATEVEALGTRALAVPTDVSDFAAVDALADAAYAEFGAVHVVCNNAGVLIFGDLQDLKIEDWNWLLGVNVFGVLNGIYAFL